MMVIKRLPFHVITLTSIITSSLSCMDQTSMNTTISHFSKYFYAQRCSSSHTHPSIKVVSADNVFSYQLCASKASISKYLKKNYDLTSTTYQEYSYNFDAKTSSTAAFLITAYIQCASTEYQSIIEKTITQNPTLTKNFDIFSEVMRAAQSLNIKPLTRYLNNYIFTSCMNPEQQTLTLGQDQSSFYRTLMTHGTWASEEIPFTIHEESAIKSLIVSPNKKYIVTTHLSPCKKYLMVTIYNCTNPSESLVTLPLKIEHNRESASLEFSPDSSLLAIKTDRKISLYACEDFTKKNNKITSNASLTTDFSHLLAFSFTHDSKKIIVTTCNGLGIIYDCATFDIVGKLDLEKQQVLDKPLFTPDDTQVIIALDHEYALYSCTEYKKIISRRTGVFPINALTLSPDGKELIVQAEPLCLFVTTEGLQFQASVKTDLFTLTKTAFSHDSLYSAVTSNNACYLFKRGVNTPAQYYISEHDILHVVFSPKQPYLMLFDKQACTLYNYETQKLIKSIPSDCIGGAQAIFAPDGRFFVITCNKTGKIYHTYPLEEILEVCRDSKSTLPEDTQK